MKKTYIILVAGSLFFAPRWCNGQSVGVRLNTQFSGKEAINGSHGFGGYININDFSDKYEILFFADRNRIHISREREDDIFNRGLLGIAGLYNIRLNEFINFKAGPSLTYNWIQEVRYFYLINIIESYEARFTGIGLTTSLNFPNIFSLPVDLDIFISPEYLIKTRQDVKSGDKDYHNHLQILNLQAGISYRVKD